MDSPSRPAFLFPFFFCLRSKTELLAHLNRPALFLASYGCEAKENLFPSPPFLSPNFTSEALNLASSPFLPPHRTHGSFPPPLLKKRRATHNPEPPPREILEKTFFPPFFPPPPPLQNILELANKDTDSSAAGCRSTLRQTTQFSLFPLFPPQFAGASLKFTKFFSRKGRCPPPLFFCPKFKESQVSGWASFPPALWVLKDHVIFFLLSSLPGS